MLHRKVILEKINGFYRHSDGLDICNTAIAFILKIKENINLPHVIIVEYFPTKQKNTVKISTNIRTNKWKIRRSFFIWKNFCMTLYQELRIKNLQGRNDIKPFYLRITPII